MKPTRREFLAAAAGTAALTSEDVVRAATRHADTADSPATVARNEDFWAEIARAYPVDRSALNLNNAGVSPAPSFVLRAMQRHVDFSNELPARNLWQILQPQRETVRKQLARVFGCDSEEVAVTRNASEGLQTFQFGFDLERGDEVLCTELDYGRMLTTFRQRERREGVKLVTFPIPAPNDDPSRITELYRQRITPRTRMILTCHVISPTGQIMPVREIAALGRERGIPVIVDGAHSFGHLDFELSDLECDYYATSLHKWSCAPHGTGMMFVRRDKIGSVWPLMAAAESQRTNVRKFEEIGTHPLANSLAIAEAMTFLDGIGKARKQARLLYLRDYWAKRVAGLDRVRMFTSLAPGASAGFASFAIDGIRSRKLAGYLWSAHKIQTTGYNIGDSVGLRASSHVYTTLPEKDRFCEVIERVAKDGLPT